jgi:hypothetical protein
MTDTFDEPGISCRENVIPPVARVFAPIRTPHLCYVTASTSKPEPGALAAHARIRVGPGSNPCAAATLWSRVASVSRMNCATETALSRPSGYSQARIPRDTRFAFRAVTDFCV